MRLVTVAVLALSLPLSGCGEEAVERGDDDARTAVGEVRGGTISDAMLPLDTVQSQSPQLREVAPPPSQETDADAPLEGADAPQPEPAETPAPVEPAPSEG